MSKEINPTLTRRNVLACIGATGAGITLGVHGAAAGEKKDKDDIYLPIAMAWQEALDGDAVEAFPDSDGDGIVDFDDDDGEWDLDELCELYEDDEIDDPLDSDLRTDDQVTDLGDPLIDLHDVTPGDEGEATLYYQLCSAIPADVWLKAPKVGVDKKLQHAAMARVWYDVDDDGDADVGDNVYQEGEPIVAQGSLKHVLGELEDGVRLSTDPDVASLDDEEGVFYYAYPRVNTSGDENPPAEGYDPVRITDDNIKEYLDDTKVEEIQNLSDGVRLHIEGVGYAAMDLDQPLSDLYVTLRSVVRNEQGQVVGFEWDSNLPVSRIEMDGDGETHLNAYDDAREGVALAPRDEDGELLPLNGFTFGVGSEDEPECQEEGQTGAVGFEWWVPDDAKLGEKVKMKVDFDVKANPCEPEPPEECPTEFGAFGVDLTLTDCEVVDGTVEGTFEAEVVGELGSGTQVRIFEPGGNVGADVNFNPNDDVGTAETFTETSPTGVFNVAIGTGLANSEFGALCCLEVEPPVDGKEAKEQVADS